MKAPDYLVDLFTGKKPTILRNNCPFERGMFRKLTAILEKQPDPGLKVYVFGYPTVNPHIGLRFDEPIAKPSESGKNRRCP
jgi:hypothetical protein